MRGHLHIRRLRRLRRSEYHAGEEIYVSYGAHTNDFLLAEYGFVLMANRWDKICLDDVILPRLSPVQKKLLQDRELFGPFLLDIKTLGCRKTQAAIRLLCPCSRPKWDAFSWMKKAVESTVERA